VKLEPWQRNQYVVVLTVAALHLGVDFSHPFLPLYVRYLGVTDLGEAALWSGLIVGIAPLGASIMSPVWGNLADRYGYKRMVLRALVGISLMTLALAAAPNVWWAFAARCVLGLIAGFTAMAMALAVSAGPRERVGSVVGLIQAAQFLPLAIGPPIGGLISDAFGLRANFVVSAVFCSFSGLLICLFREDRSATAQPAGGRREARRKGSARDLLKLPGFLALVALLGLIQFADRSLPPILPLYLAAIETPESQLATVSGLVISAGAIASAISSALYGRLARPGRARRALLLALAGGALCVGPLALVRGWDQVLVLRLLLGLVAGGAVGVGYTLGTRIAPPERAGLTLGFLSSSTMLGGAASPFMTGLLGRFSLGAVFLVDAACFVLALVLTVVLPRSVDRASGPERTPS
jgi:DHA1 family multidrug resistance protein-like MFS transporter